jgi:hypothetical protein
MRIFERPPWWIAFPVSGGLTIIGIFATDVVPSWLRVALFWGGIVLSGVGAIAAVLHFRWGSPEPNKDNLKAYSSFAETSF